MYGLLGLEKLNSVAFPDVKLLVENRHKEWKLSASQNLKVP